MNWDQIEGQWKDLKGKVRQKWGKFTDDDFEQIAGRKDQLVGKLQKHYGMNKEKAEEEADQFMSGLDEGATKH
ncbi:MAG: CsbD family protein [Oligoflexus sp.]